MVITITNDFKPEPVASLMKKTSCFSCFYQYPVLSKFKKGNLLVLLLLSVPAGLIAQGEIPVNLYTGTPNIEIPIWNLTHKDLSEPISLVYNAKGVKLQESNSRFGISWDVRAGGSITREVRGLPDDFKGSGTDRRRGWLYQKYNTSGYLNGYVASATNTSDLSAATCLDENQDNDNINWFVDGSGLYDNDSEPDLFYYNVGGASGRRQTHKLVG